MIQTHEGQQSRLRRPSGHRLRVRQAVDDSEMDITPMIDITFLLLIFFLVASKMDQSTAVRLPPAQHATSIATRNAVIVTVDSAQDDRAAIYKGDGVLESQRIDSRDLAQVERELADYVNETILEDTRKTQVLIKAAGALRHRDVARVLQAVSRVAEVRGLHVAVLEGQ